MDPTPAIPILLIGAGVIIALVAIVGGLLHSRRERLLTHQERMKALELGHDLPQDAATARLKAAFGADSSSDKRGVNRAGEQAGESLARKCFSTALWVAFWGFLFAGQSSVPRATSAAIAVSIAIAVSAGLVGVTAVVCGTILAARTPPPAPRTTTAKTEFETDALDVVSRRG